MRRVAQPAAGARRARRSVPAAALAALLGALAGPVAAAPRALTFLHTPPTVAARAEDLRLTGSVFGAEEMAEGVVFFRCGEGPWKMAELLQEGADTYVATLPGADLGCEWLQYYATATDWNGDTRAIFASRAEPQKVLLRKGWTAPAPPPQPEPEPVEPEPAPEPAASALDEAIERLGAGPSRPVARLAGVERWDPDAAAPAGPAEGTTEALADDLKLYAAEEPVAAGGGPDGSLGAGPWLTSVVSAAEIRARHLRTLADLMKTLPGFETSRDVRGFWRVAVRGLRSDAGILVLQDGLRVNNPWDGRVAWELPLEGVERVEVTRGPGAAQHGDGALLAVVNLVSAQEPGAAVAVAGGSFLDLRAHARAARRFGRLLLSAEADGTSRHGYEADLKRDAITKDLDKPAGRTDDGRTGWGAALRAQWKAGPGGAKASGGVRAQAEDRGALAGFYDVLGPGSRLGWLRLAADAGVEVPVKRWTLSARAFADGHDTDRLFVLLPPGYQVGSTLYDDGVKERTRISLWSGGFSLGGAGRLFEGNELSAGLRLEVNSLSDFLVTANVRGEEKVDPPAMVDEPGPFPARSRPYRNRTRVGVYAQDEWRLAAPLALVAGLRLDSVSGVDTLQLQPRLALAWRPPELAGLAAKVLVSRAFRSPTYEERLSVQSLSTALVAGQSVGSLTLKPTAVTTLEAGLELARPLAGGRAVARADAFWSDLEDPIEAPDETGSGPVWSNRAAGVRVLGAEAEARYDWGSRGTMWMNVSWFRARDLQVDAETPSFSLLVDVPQVRANWGLGLPLGEWLDLGLQATFGAERRNNARTALEATRRYRIPAYGLFGASLRTRPWKHLEASLDVQNVTDATVLDDVPRPDETRMPGLLPREGVRAMLVVRAGW